MKKEIVYEDYVRIVIPKEYVCLYRHILRLLADYGEAMLKDCSCPCKDKNKYIIECYNMFNAAVAAREIGNNKLANLLIKYIKATLKFKDNCGCEESDMQSPNVWYIGQITKTRPEFEELPKSVLLSHAEAYSIEEKTVNFNINNSCWYVMLPDGVKPHLAVYTSYGITSTATQTEIENGFITGVRHDDIVIDDIVYHVYVNRGSSLVDSNSPASFTIK